MTRLEVLKKDGTWHPQDYDDHTAARLLHDQLRRYGRVLFRLPEGASAPADFPLPPETDCPTCPNQSVANEKAPKPAKAVTGVARNSRKDSD